MRRYIFSAICGLMILAFPQPSRARRRSRGSPTSPRRLRGLRRGTLIAYGGYNYVIQADGTMLLVDQSADAGAGGDDQGPGQAYQIPDGYAYYAAGTTIAYGGATT